MALTHGIAARRVQHVIDQVGLDEVADRRAKTFSLGMSQRLGIASAMLGDPGTLVLDEPVNGLDAEGIRWIRTLLKRLAEEGRAILLSSHLMSEMALTADRLIIVGRGRLIADTTVEAVVADASAGGAVHVSSPQARDLAAALERLDGATVRLADDHVGLDVQGIPASRVGEIAAARGAVLHELIARQVSLEDAYMQLTSDSVQYRANLDPEASVLERAA